MWQTGRQKIRTERQQEFPEFNLLQTSYVQFWFADVVIKGFNFAHVQKKHCPALCYDFVLHPIH